MAVPNPRLLARASRATGASKTALRNFAKSFDDSQTVNRIFENLTRAPDRAVSGSVSAATGTIPTTAKYAALGGTGVGGTLVGKQYLENQNAQRRFETKQEQAQTAEDILNDPSLDADTKQNLLERIVEQGTFAPPGVDPTKGGGFLDKILPGGFPDLFSMKGILLILVVIYGGRAISRRVGDA